MKLTKTTLTLASLTALISGLQAQSSFSLGFSDYLSSSNATNTGPDFQVSVESSYTGWKGEYDDEQVFGATAPGAINSGEFNGPLVGYRFWGTDGSAINTVAVDTIDPLDSIISDISTTDTNLQSSSFGKIWETTAPNGSAFDTTPDYQANINNLNEGATGTIDITGISEGSAYFIYGAYRSTPIFNISTSVRDLGDVHASANGGTGDGANNNEFYIARVDFVNAGDMNTINWNLGSGPNGRFSSIIVTDTSAVPETSTLALLGLSGLALLIRRRR